MSHERHNTSRVCCRRQCKTTCPPWEIPGHSHRHLDVLTHCTLCHTGPSKDTRRKGPTRCCQDPEIHSVTLFLSLPPFSFSYFFPSLSLSPSHFLLKKIHNIDLRIWPCLHLNPERGISPDHNMVASWDCAPSWRTSLWKNTWRGSLNYLMAAS